MKFTLAILTVLVPFFVHAGGGGGLRPGMESGMVRPEIVYHLGESNGVTSFAFGQLDNNEWKIQNITLPTSEIELDYNTKQALQVSKKLKNWAEVK
ncbi:MAG: hypothetical protein JSU04_20300 [Bdellovibrionales bacterium]|nr:hypothetical protein [Bdellovibrionales bacterium]